MIKFDGCRTKKPLDTNYILYNHIIFGFIGNYFYFFLPVLKQNANTCIKLSGL